MNLDETLLEGLTEEQFAQLQAAASRVSANAYTPYSGMHVGAAVLTDGGEIFTGCNVENASYGLTICAERAAIFAAVSSQGSSMRIRAIAIFCGANIPCSPCGACRQVIAEFGDSIPVVYGNGQAWERTTSAELLPHGFRM